MALITLTLNKYCVTINTRGGCVDRFTYGDTDIFRPRPPNNVIEDASLSGLFPMLPLVNRIRGNKFNCDGHWVQLPINEKDSQFFLHGDGWLSEWHLSDCNAQKVSLTLDKKTELYHYQATLLYSLDEFGLSISLGVMNMGSPFPYSLGLHPYFICEPKDKVCFNAKGYWPEGQNNLPEDYQEKIPQCLDFTTPTNVPERWINNCFYAPEQSVYINRIDPGLQINVFSKENYWVLYRPVEFAESEASYMCFEPQQYPIDAHSQEAVPLLDKNQKSEIMLRVKVKQEPQATIKLETVI
ncbi:hypothetical protein [Psychromonas ossibalaenae]|uniref:aldose epimerase family protein n=1 Tax=Psychromonas ossibalaenae TaxID=444922 RepID=UPI0003645C47|nr:hypothetical protein [Psychromonas ossibalaenae]